jgi:hypothetical protein
MVRKENSKIRETALGACRISVDESSKQNGNDQEKKFDSGKCNQSPHESDQENDAHECLEKIRGVFDSQLSKFDRFSHRLGSFSFVLHLPKND